MCAFCRPSPSAPRRIIFISLLVCKTTEKIVIERNSCFSVSGIQCSNAAPHPGRAQAEGENWLFSSRNNPMYVALSPHDSPSFGLQSKLFLVWSWWWKVESDVVDPDRWSCKLVGWCPQVAAPKNAVTQGGVYIFPHTAFGFICFSSQNHDNMIFWGNYLELKAKGWVWASWNRSGSRTLLPGRW